MTELEDPQAWYHLGRYYMQRCDYRRAYDAYQQAINRDSRNSNIWCSVAVFYDKISQHRDALDAYCKAIRLNPYMPEFWFNLGTLYEKHNGQIQDAIIAYNRAFELDNNHCLVQERLAMLKRNLETGRNDGPPLPRASDIDPQRYDDFIQAQENKISVAQLQLNKVNRIIRLVHQQQGHLKLSVDECISHFHNILNTLASRIT